MRYKMQSLDSGTVGRNYHLQYNIHVQMSRIPHGSKDTGLVLNPSSLCSLLY